MYSQLCLIRGFEIGIDQIEEFEGIILNKFGVRIKYDVQVKTLPLLDEEGYVIPGTGGRNDLFFYIHEEDVEKFSISRMHLGVRWWEDVIAHESNRDSYHPSFIKSRPTIW